MLKKLLFIVIFSFACVAHGADVTPFLAPDNSYGAFKYFLEKSGNEIFLASYEFTSPEIAQLLIDSGKNITILIEGNPVGGLKNQEVLCEMQKNGIDIQLYAGSMTYMHAKYAVSDNFSLITTENFGASGFPVNDRGNRGWGVIIEDIDTSLKLKSLFIKDIIYTGRYSCKNSDEFSPKTGIFYFTPYTYENQSVSVITDSFVTKIIEIIDSAEEKLKIEEFYIYRYWGTRDQYTENAFLEQAIQKAREGVEVKILLDSYWYNTDEEEPVSNYYTNQYVNEIAKKENISLESRLIELDKLNLEKAHVKGMIIDDYVFVSSVNWNEHSPTKNREIGVLIEGDVSDYFEQAFDNDWSGNRKLPVTGMITGDENLVVSAIAGIIVAVIIIFIFRKRTQAYHYSSEDD